MTITETYLKGCFEIEPTVFGDDRGTFFESFNEKEFIDKTNLSIHFVQDNQSTSERGVVRGLHFQTGNFAQAKLVRVIQGKVLDVAVDLRRNSSTFGQHFSCILTGKNNKQLFVPRGFAHGFSVLEDDTIFAYKCDNYYNKASESGIVYNDPQLNIDWMLDEQEIVLSEKDKVLELLNVLG
ncbi:dTDP-4-dehydrorhamnose 3,5-epimerase [Polaribacter pacificus]|uniref:dTDP-4-dehydrorhamnose 3,5-epimerase n=1 Tax=Polaribacter pacificus TaxID=1775173 RepID=A0A917HVY9_9FLAO|nr:dTDP-4-dehydrorhamnose 3,5-epimerase [Polaribacter pacificus]GGG93627.1 dTDP-4-dehydrorhamnose 3,5-epimerase [Polaribacter pacificus]